VLRDTESCDLVVVLAHTGFEKDPLTGEPSPTGDENFAWRLAHVPGVDVLLTGHVHAHIEPMKLGRAVVSEPGRRADTVTRLDLELVHEPTGWTIGSWQGSNLATSDADPDPRVVELLEPAHAEVVAALDAEVGEITRKVSVTGCRLHDCTALDLVHAVQLEATGAQLSLAAALSESTPDFQPGPVTRRAIYGLYVYPNVLVSLRLSGAQVKDVLEHAARYYLGLDCEPGQGCTLQTDPAVRYYNVDTMAGVTYRIDPNRPEGSRILDLRYQGLPIDPEAWFVVVTNNYRATGGGGFPHLADAEVVWTRQVQVKQHIEAFLAAHRPWTPRVDGNWSIGPDVSEPEKDR
jgi:2',3'-cyclic-nucleotide 2'-phosphodiesterase/3'-nucleotidase